MSRSGQRLFLRLGASALALSTVLVACGDDDSDSAGRSDDGSERRGGPSQGERTAERGDSGQGALPEASSWAATAKPELSEVAIYDSTEAAEPSFTLPNPDEHGTPLVFLVDGVDAAGERVPVFLPVPPNGSRGWVDTSDVDLLANPYRIRVEVGAHRLTVTNAGEEIVNTEVGVGRDGRETPTGLYYLKELIEPPDPNGDYGPYAYGISGFTNSPEAAAEFGDGGVIGIHGTNDPSSIGRDVSSGCIRLPNDIITEMAGYLPLGTPVEIVA